MNDVWLEPGKGFDPHTHSDYEEFINESSFFQKRHFIFFDYACTAVNTKVTLEKREASNFVWIKPEKALKLSLEKYTGKL